MINKLIKSLVKDIIFTLVAVLITIPVWNSFNLNEIATTANAYDNYEYVNYDILNEAKYSFNAVDDKYAMMHIETSDIVVYNSSNTEDDYSFMIKIDKNTNTDGIKINVNNNIYSLNDLVSFTDDNSRYFVIDSKSIVASSYKYSVSLWSNIDKNENINYKLFVSANAYI